MTVLSFQGVSKRFDGREVIRGLTISVAEHTIYGLLGQNGAGKTTTMKMALGLLKPTDGSIFVLGEPVSYGETKTNRYVGYLPDVPAFYGYMRPAEYLALCGEVSGLDRKKVKGRSAELLTLVGLKGINRSIGGFSRGMKQRLGIAMALLGSPRLLILDEPTNGLDPAGIQEMRALIHDMPDACGATVLISSHLLGEMEQIVSQVGIINHGQLLFEGPLTELQRHSRGNVVLRLLAPDRGAAVLRRYGLTPQPADNGCLLPTMEDARLAALVQDLAAEGAGVVGVERQTKNLEEIFLSLTNTQTGKEVG